MTENKKAMQSSEFKDKKVGLVVFGIFQIILGGFCALMVPFMVLSIFTTTLVENSSAPAMEARMIIPSILFYVFGAAWFICMGIGSIMAKRWARALTLIQSWIWLIGGLISIIALSIIMPEMFKQMSMSEELPGVVEQIVMYVMIAFMILFYIVLPGIVILFYRSNNVKATCEFRNPDICWTDKCPLPILALSLILALWSLGSLFTGFYGWVIPFFGLILKGIPGAGAAVALMLLFAYVAWGIYKLDIKAWWYANLLISAWFISAGITFLRVSIWDFYDTMNFPDESLEMMKQFGIIKESTMVLFVGIWFAVALGYLLYTKKYFKIPV